MKQKIFQNDKEKMEWLVDEVNKHCYNYYVLDNPTISDYEFDRLYDELVDLEKKLGYSLDYSPTKRVGAEVQSSIEKFVHKEKLYSLGKVNTYENLEKWICDIKKDFPNATFGVEHKFDGLTLCLTYNDGILQSVATRGNGSIGENVTNQAKTIKSIPLKINYKGEVSVQGEGIIYISDLEKYNKTASEPLKNARNAVAGAIRNLDSKQTAKRNLNIFLYNVAYIDDRKLLKSQKDIERFLQENGFKNIKSNFYDNAEDIIRRVKEMDNQRNDLDYLTDGAVIKVNEFDIRNEMGETIKYPRWALAFKYAPEEVSALLKDIIWQVGKTGKVTPTAILEPVELAGALISRATLNNMGDIKRKKVKSPCRVFLRRSNEVIPEIMGIAELLPESEDIIAPTMCPCCGSKLEEIGALLYCLNDQCKEQIINKITHFVSKEAMNIDGVSEKSIIQMYELLGVRNVADLYYLKEEDLYKLENFKDKKVKNFLKGIENSKKAKLNNFIYSLCIPNVGVKTAKDLANNFASLDLIKSAKIQDLSQIYDVGEIVGSCVVDFFQNQKNLELVDRLLSAGVQITNEEVQIKTNILTGKKVVLTGTLENFGRSEATKILESFGAQVLSSVSIKCDFVIAGENAGSKLSKAQELGIKILQEKDFLDIINKND